MTAKKERPAGRKVVPAKRVGKPHMLNARICQNFVNGFSTGNYVRTVCGWVGLNHTTYQTWMNRGEAEIERVNALTADGDMAEPIIWEAITVELPEDDFEQAKKLMNTTKALTELFSWCPDPFESEEWKFVLFRILCQRARAESEVRALSLIQNAGHSGQWQAAAWFLERSFPDRWGRRERVALEGHDGGAVEVKQISVDDLESKIRAIRGSDEED